MLPGCRERVSRRPNRPEHYKGCYELEHSLHEVLECAPDCKFRTGPALYAAGYILARRRRSALETTETELIAMAAPAKMGESRMPKNG